MLIINTCAHKDAYLSSSIVICKHNPDSNFHFIITIFNLVCVTFSGAAFHLFDSF